MDTQWEFNLGPPFWRGQCSLGLWRVTWGVWSWQRASKELGRARAEGAMDGGQGGAPLIPTPLGNPYDPDRDRSVKDTDKAPGLSHSSALRRPWNPDTCAPSTLSRPPV